MNELSHLPVMLKEVIEYLDPEPGAVILDATLGGGGHAGEILKRISPGGRLIAVDRDPEAIERCRKKLEEYNDSVSYFNCNYNEIAGILGKEGVTELDGAVFDLGVSSFQIDDPERGFSFLREGPLDMRFDKSSGRSAREVVNSFRKEELADIIYNYGEERYSRHIAEAICNVRRKKKIETTTELAEIIQRTVGKKYSRQRLHPATRTFQALRIFVNDEMGAIEESITEILLLLKSERRICVISFHSLEDRIVKNVFRSLAGDGKIKLVTKKPVRPVREETVNNSRSRSAKLRVAEGVL